MLRNFEKSPPDMEISKYFQKEFPNILEALLTTPSTGLEIYHDFFLEYFQAFKQKFLKILKFDKFFQWVSVLF